MDNLDNSAYQDTLNKFNIDDKKAYENRDAEIPIPLEWRNEMLIYHITKIDNFSYFNNNIKEQIIVVIFDSEEKINKFENDFHSKLIANINEFIFNKKNENPKKYYRGVILETIKEGIAFKIQY